MKQFGLIGYPLGHSFSKAFFTEMFRHEHPECTYENYELSHIKLLPQLLDQNPDICGLNVTIPYKEAVIGYLDELDDDAREIGAVNTISIKNGQLKGHNTDAYGFAQSIKPLLSASHQKALILGTGGSAKAVKWALTKMGIDYLEVSRSPKQQQVSYTDLDKAILSEHTIIINTTPLGMFPDIGSCPQLPFQYISDKHLLFDLVYNPDETLFLKKGREQGAITKNGHEMLEQQALKSWEIWNEVII